MCGEKGTRVQNHSLSQIASWGWPVVAVLYLSPTRTHAWAFWFGKQAQGPKEVAKIGGCNGWGFKGRPNSFRKLRFCLLSTFQTLSPGLLTQPNLTVVTSYGVPLVNSRNKNTRPIIVRMSTCALPGKSGSKLYLKPQGARVVKMRTGRTCTSSIGSWTVTARSAACHVKAWVVKI